MDSKFIFDWHESGDPRDILLSGFRECILTCADHGKPISVVLRGGEVPELRIRSVMHEVRQRLEVGVLEFSRSSGSQGSVITLASFDPQSYSVSKLIIEETDFSAESGIVLQGENSELLIVAGAYPYTLAVKFPGSDKIPFEPEYPLERYKRVAF